MHFMRKQPSKAWLNLEQEFIEVLSEIVGEKRVPVLLGKPMVHDPTWKRPVVVPTDMTLADAERNYQHVLRAYTTLKEKLDELLAEQNELDFADEIQEQRMEELDDEISADSKRIGSLKKKLSLAKRVVEELSGKLEP